MPKQSLKFKLIWLSNDSQENEASSQVLAVVKQFSENFMAHKCEQYTNDYEINVGNIYRRHTSLLYEELLFEVVCVITYSFLRHSISIKDIYLKLCRSWCSEGKCSTELQWLMPMYQGFYDGKMQVQPTTACEIGFGTLAGLTDFVYHYKFKSSGKASRDLSCHFNNAEKRIIIFMYIKHNLECSFGKKEFQKIEIPYSSILRVLVNDVEGTDPTELYLHLDCPPLIYIDKKDGIKDVATHLMMTGQRGADCYERTTKVGCECSYTLCPENVIGSCPVVNIIIPDKFNAHRMLVRLYQRCYRNTEFYYCHVKSRCYPKAAIKLKTSLRGFTFHHGNAEEKFSCYYAWATLLNRSFEIQDHIALECVDWMKLFSKCNRTNCTALEKTFYYIFKLLDVGKIIVFNRAVECLFKVFDKLPMQNDFPPGICLVRRVFVTPLRLLFLPPQPHFNNRILRKFDPNYALRVSFRDDNLKKITYPFQYHSKRTEFIQNVIGNVLREGIQIKDRHYTFLGASNSQLRDHGVWMYAEDTSKSTSSSIRKWMGDFRSINNIAKLVARMGQCFSTSEEAVQITVPEPNFQYLNDIIIKTGNWDYNFSDGIGMISEELADEINKLFYEKFKNQNEDWKTYYKPSAFQIRFGGSKGMVSVMPEQFLKGYKMLLRNSMKKFECSTSHVLEIVKHSAPRPLYLNRPLITILEQMGVSKEIFLDLQQDMITKLTEALIYESQAADLLTSQITKSYPFKKLNDVGISLTAEPFFRSLLLSIYKKNIGNINSKARISVPFHYGRNMLGVLDESKTLNPGEVFVQYSEDVRLITSELHILRGPVLVTRSPCMHPGDVRKLKAVDVPALHHIKDCVVFPAKGKRPHQDEMAGGDLDGDEYCIIWMPDLLFSCGNAHPMEYPHGTSDKDDKNKTFTVDDMINFICNYIEKDVIGLVAHSHLANADNEHDGIFSHKCMKIAKLFPLILDFAKTGEFKHLDKRDKPKMYPDFMEKGLLNNSYHSDKVLGILYRCTKAIKSMVSLGNLMPKEVDYDHNLEFPGWEEYSHLAIQERNKYNKQIFEIFQLYEINNEAEAISGNIQLVGKYCREKNDSANIVCLVNAHIKQICKKIYFKFLKDVEEESISKGLSTIDAKIAKYRRASALYMVTYKEHPVHYLSFPWCVAGILADVRNECLKMKEAIPSFIFSSLEDKINSTILTITMKELSLHKDLQIGTCAVYNIVIKILKDWALKYKLVSLKNGKHNICDSCFAQAFNLSLDQICSNNEKSIDTSTEYQINESTNCSCSAARLILNFLKFYATYHISNKLEKCNKTECFGLNLENLQTVALSTYTSIAMTYNLSFLGIADDDSVTDASLSPEGDPVRISVENNDLCNLLTENTEEVENLLKEMFGVHEVYIQGQEDANGHKYLIVNSVGKEWQMWKLEEFILQSNFTDVVIQNLQDVI